MSVARSWYSGIISMPIECLPSLFATMFVVPEPMNGSSTVSPSLVKSLMNHSGRDSYIGAPLAIDHPFLDVQHKRARRLQHSQELLGDRQEPLNVFIGLNAAVGVLALVGVRRGCEN